MEFDDLISRAATIDAVENLASSMSVCINVDEYNGMRDMKYRALKAIKECPSAQPDHSGDINGKVDLIDRQAVIDLLKQMRKDGDMVPWEGKDVFARIRKLPSAQPEIIRCKDCSKWQTIDCPFFSKYITVMPNEEQYCSLAERRTDG